MLAFACILNFVLRATVFSFSVRVLMCSFIFRMSAVLWLRQSFIASMTCVLDAACFIHPWFYHTNKIVGLICGYRYSLLSFFFFFLFCMVAFTSNFQGKPLLSEEWMRQYVVAFPFPFANVCLFTCWTYVLDSSYSASTLTLWAGCVHVAFSCEHAANIITWLMHVP